MGNLKSIFKFSSGSFGFGSFFIFNKIMNTKSPGNEQKGHQTKSTYL